jgi:hypothetical protein
MTSASVSPVVVEGPDDWARLTERGLTTVIDPMVFRAGELFLRGRSGRALGSVPREALDEDRAWEFLDKNLLAIGFFLDALILNERLPLFNYSDSFDMHLNFEERSFAAYNDADRPALELVDVRYGAYMPIKARALDALRARIAAAPVDGTGGPRLHEDGASIVRELASAEYRWNISLWPELEALLPTDFDRQIARFLVGGMIFGEYADLMESEHWLQPKRASLFVQATSGAASRDRGDERALFEWVATQYGLPILASSQPTFLHRVLHEATSLRDVPAIVKRLRASGAVADYRVRRREMLEEWRAHGGVRPDTERDLQALKRELAGRGTTFTEVSEAGVSLVKAATAPSVGSAVDATRKLAPLLGWLLDRKPGRRHVKLLADSLHARGRYPYIERSVRTLWAQG